ncbi:hypothetical protein MHBO_005301 [Bonamia ostreae]|uniref:Uncharacterized protein n=1 Tax=Bonamia ostreae TaxID=126728 RepID=A0ABV2AFW6_9EUKA
MPNVKNLDIRKSSSCLGTENGLKCVFYCVSPYSPNINEVKCLDGNWSPNFSCVSKKKKSLILILAISIPLGVLFIFGIILLIVFVRKWISNRRSKKEAANETDKKNERYSQISDQIEIIHIN